jgi:hypothetical protein
MNGQIDNSIIICAVMTTILFIIATYHNYNMVYKREIYMDSFGKIIKLFIMIFFFTFTRDVDDVF